MTITRRSLMIGAAASIPLVSTIRYAGAQAAEFNYKYANNLPLTHPMNLRAQEAVEKIREETGGRVAIQIFPSNQLGADTDMLSQVRSGGVEFFTLSPLILSTLVANASISGIGFAFSDYDAVWAAMDGDLGKYVRGEIEKSNLVVMEKIWDNGFRQITSSVGPIETPANLEGFKIRVPVSPLWTSMFTAFKSAPASINFAEVYSALQTKIVDGQENRSPSSPRPSSTRCSSSARSPTTCGTASGSSPTSGPGRRCRRTCARSSLGTSTRPA